MAANIETNWIKLGKEIGSINNGIAILRVLQAHGLSHLLNGNRQQCSIEMLIDYAHKEK